MLNMDSIKNLVDYDFKNEAPWKDVRTETDPILKFRRYRNNNADKDSNIKFDCDNSNGTCSLTDSIYSRLWGWSYESRNKIPSQISKSLSERWGYFGSDTMNSFATTYSQATKIYNGDVEKTNHNAFLRRFASLTHSVGNFTLVPVLLNGSDQKSFNQYRGYNSENGKYFVYDYFDLSLKLIKESTDSATFESYIDTFYLNDYVDENYNIIPLFKGHKEILKEENISLANPDRFLPKNEAELNEYLKNVIKAIESRGRTIVLELEKKDPAYTTSLQGKINAKLEIVMSKVKNKATSLLQKIKGALKVFFAETLVVSFFFLLLTILAPTVGSPNPLFNYHQSYSYYEIFSYFMPALNLLVVSAFIASFLLIVRPRFFDRLYNWFKFSQCPYCYKMFSKKLKTKP